MATVFDGVEFIMSGDVVSGLVFADAGIYDAAVGSGGLLISAVVSGFGQVDISSGGEAIGTFIGSEAFEYVAGGGLTIGAQVASGGKEEVASGAVSSDAQIIGGTELVYGGALAMDTTVSGSNQAETAALSSPSRRRRFQNPSEPSVVVGVTAAVSCFGLLPPAQKRFPPQSRLDSGCCRSRRRSPALIRPATSVSEASNKASVEPSGDPTSRVRARRASAPSLGMRG